MPTWNLNPQRKLIKFIQISTLHARLQFFVFPQISIIRLQAEMAQKASYDRLMMILGSFMESINHNTLITPWKRNEQSKREKKKESKNKTFESMYMSKQHRINFVNPSSLVVETWKDARSDHERARNRNQHNNIL